MVTDDSTVEAEEFFIVELRLVDAQGYEAFITPDPDSNISFSVRRF